MKGGTVRTIYEDPRCDAYGSGSRPSAQRCVEDARVPSGLCIVHGREAYVYVGVGGSAESPTLLRVRGIGRVARKP